MSYRPSSQADGFADHAHDDTVVREIAAALDVQLHEILPGCRLVDDFGANAWDLHTLRTGLEVQFAITIPVLAVRSWASVADVQGYIDRRLSPERITS